MNKNLLFRSFRPFAPPNLGASEPRPLGHPSQPTRSVKEPKPRPLEQRPAAVPGFFCWKILKTHSVTNVAWTFLFSAKWKHQAKQQIFWPVLVVWVHWRAQNHVFWGSWSWIIWMCCGVPPTCSDKVLSFLVAFNSFFWVSKRNLPSHFGFKRTMLTNHPKFAKAKALAPALKAIASHRSSVGFLWERWYMICVFALVFISLYF